MDHDHPELSLADLKDLIEAEPAQECPHCGRDVAFAVRDGKPVLECQCGYWCRLVVDDQRGACGAGDKGLDER